MFLLIHSIFSSQLIPLSEKLLSQPIHIRSALSKYQFLTDNQPILTPKQEFSFLLPSSKDKVTLVIGNKKLCWNMRDKKITLCPLKTKQAGYLSTFRVAFNKGDKTFYIYVKNKKSNVFNMSQCITTCENDLVFEHCSLNNKKQKFFIYENDYEDQNDTCCVERDNPTPPKICFSDPDSVSSSVSSVSSEFVQISFQPLLGMPKGVKKMIDAVKKEDKMNRPSKFRFLNRDFMEMMCEVMKRKKQRDRVVFPGVGHTKYSVFMKKPGNVVKYAQDVAKYLEQFPSAFREPFHYSKKFLRAFCYAE